MNARAVVLAVAALVTVSIFVFCAPLVFAGSHVMAAGVSAVVVLLVLALHRVSRVAAGIVAALYALAAAAAGTLFALYAVPCLTQGACM